MLVDCVPCGETHDEKLKRFCMGCGFCTIPASDCCADGRDERLRTLGEMTGKAARDAWEEYQRLVRRHDAVMLAAHSWRVSLRGVAEA